MYHIQKLGHLKPLFPTPVLSFVADVGISNGTGTTIIQWDEEFGNGDLDSGGVNVPNNGTGGGLNPNVDFTQATPTDRMTSADGGTVANLFDDSNAGRSEGSLVLYMNDNSAGTSSNTVLSCAGGTTTRRFQIRPRTGVGFTITIRTDGVTLRHIRCAALPANTATVVIITRAADGTTNIYYDGVAQAITTDTFNVGEFIPNINILAIGDLITNNSPVTFADAGFNGQLSVFQLYEEVLTQNQVVLLTATLQDRF